MTQISSMNFWHLILLCMLRWCHASSTWAWCLTRKSFASLLCSLITICPGTSTSTPINTRMLPLSLGTPIDCIADSFWLLAQFFSVAFRCVLAFSRLLTSVRVHSQRDFLLLFLLLSTRTYAVLSFGRASITIHDTRYTIHDIDEFRVYTVTSLYPYILNKTTYSVT